MLKTPLAWLTLAAAALLLAGCANRPTLGPGKPAAISRDGPEAVIPPDLHRTPDAEPKLEPIRKGGPNKPYEVLGQRYEPVAEDRPLTERGLASWYGRKFHGRQTASGEIYNMYAMTAAHPTMPIPSYARVRNPANGREVLLRINDRGPFHRGRIIDLSYTAALKLDLLRGVGAVEVERITYEDIRAGLWRRDGSSPLEAPVFAAAEAVGAPPRETTAQGASPEAAAPRSAPGFWLQLGAFSKLDGAEAFRTLLVTEQEWLTPLLAIFKDRQLHRLQAGPYPTRADALQAAERVRGVTAVVVERR